MSYSATCSCKKLSIHFSKAIEETSICHCNECKKRTGSLFGLQARVEIDDSKIIGEFSTYSRVSDSGSTVTTRFCPNCGSSVFWSIGGGTRNYIVAVGMLDSKIIASPKVSVYEQRLQNWYEQPKCIVKHIK